jgi:hypothetical protein
MTPSPDSSGAVRVVRDTERIPGPPGVPRTSMWKHPAMKAGGALTTLAFILSMMIPLWQTWIERGHTTDRLEARITVLEQSNKALKGEVKRLQAENAQLRKRLR